MIMNRRFVRVTIDEYRRLNDVIYDENGMSLRNVSGIETAPMSPYFLIGFWEEKDAVAFETLRAEIGGKR